MKTKTPYSLIASSTPGALCHRQRHECDRTTHCGGALAMESPTIHAKSLRDNRSTCSIEFETHIPPESPFHCVFRSLCVLFFSHSLSLSSGLLFKSARSNSNKWGWWLLPMPALKKKLCHRSTEWMSPHTGLGALENENNWCAAPRVSQCALSSPRTMSIGSAGDCGQSKLSAIGTSFFFFS